MHATLAMLCVLGFGAPSWAAPDDHPLQATVALDCPRCDEPGGAVRIEVPLGLRLPEDPGVGTSLALVDAEGRPVPFALATSTAADEPVSLRVRSTDDPDTWTIEPPDRPVDTLRFSISSNRPTAATVTVRDSETGETYAERLVWRWASVSQDRLILPRLLRPLTVSVHWHGPRPARPLGITGWRSAEITLPDHVIELETGPTVLTESGETRTAVTLPRPLPLRSLEVGLDPGLDVVERPVSVVQGASEFLSPVILGSSTLRRLRMGSSRIDDTTVDLERPPSDTLLWLDIGARSGPPLEVSTVSARLPRQVLYVRTGHQGPLTLLGGDVDAIEPTSELQSALLELISAEVGAARTGEVGANPDWIPPEVQAGLSAPGALLEGEARFTHEAPVSGPAGLVRLPLPAEVVVATVGQPHRLRLVVDGEEDRLVQVPHLSRRLPVDHVVPEVPLERVEDGSLSRIVLRNPNPGVPLTGLSLHSDAPLFRRTVSVLHPVDGQLRMLRLVEWHGGERPGTLSIELPGTVVDELVVELDNGDDPPLPLTGADLRWGAWELIADLPDGGATLLVGSRQVEAPEHDLGLLRDQLGRRATAVATVGPLVERTPPPLGGADKIALWAGLLALVGGLALLVLRLVRGVPLEGEE
jgi:hypothetical protein